MSSSSAMDAAKACARTSPRRRHCEGFRQLRGRELVRRRPDKLHGPFRGPQCRCPGGRRRSFLQPCGDAEDAAASPSPGDKKTAASAPSTRKNGEDKDSARFPSTSNKEEDEDAVRTPPAIKNWEDEDVAGAPSTSGDGDDAAATLSTRKNEEDKDACSFHFH
jgi:hypothetical protein